MQTKLEFVPIPQTGHNCKTTAIAAVDQYFAKKLGVAPIPLHKSKKSRISIREISKRFGSVQGELLEISQLTDVLNAIGYKYELIDFNNKNYEFFQSEVKKAIDADNPIIGFFRVNPYNKEGSPIEYNSYGDDSNKSNEHAAVLHGYRLENYYNKDLIYTHWNAERSANLLNFFKSSKTLDDARQPEYYENIKSKDHTKKYDLCEANEKGALKTLSPKENSGFKGKMIIVKGPKTPDEIQKFRNFRENNLKFSLQGFLAWNLYLRIIIGILATILVIPAIAVHCRSQHGYKATFFKEVADISFHAADACVID